MVLLCENNPEKASGSGNLAVLKKEGYGKKEI